MRKTNGPRTWRGARPTGRFANGSNTTTNIAPPAGPSKAPSRRGTRRALETALETAHERALAASGSRHGGCTLCERAYAHGDVTWSGRYRELLIRVGECCIGHLDAIDAVSIYVDLRRADDAARFTVYDEGESPWSYSDRLWFAAHPNRPYRIRPAFPEEFDKPPRQRDPTIPQVIHAVIVRQVGAGAYRRYYIADPSESRLLLLLGEDVMGQYDTGIATRIKELEEEEEEKARHAGVVVKLRTATHGGRK